MNPIKTNQSISRNNIKNEGMGSLEKLQTVETPFKMRDVLREEKLERCSSLKGESRADLLKQKAVNGKYFTKNKLIGSSFLGSSLDAKSKNGDQHVGPHHFKAHQLLGTGSFGEVFLVEEIATQELYAMKVLSKEKIYEQGLLKYAFAEKDIMAEMTKIDHPFVVKIKYTFQATESLFMVMQFCSGGDLS
jgi:hypothetical protein